ncbi:hypothetical protein KCP73_14330 [Salmonella enterica subsp. enterica]|nr:hypothetical protein KCP73_14330 [Salmonella enterica subsp. enterica]
MSGADDVKNIAVTVYAAGHRPFCQINDFRRQDRQAPARNPKHGIAIENHRLAWSGNAQCGEPLAFLLALL